MMADAGVPDVQLWEGGQLKGHVLQDLPGAHPAQ